MTCTAITRIKLASAAIAVIAGLAVTTAANAGEMDAHHKVVSADEITFQPGPGTLPAGAQVAVLDGNPAEEGPFILRLKFPAGYVIPPHTHPKVEHVTVISGEFRIGAGEEVDPSVVNVLKPGGFVMIPTGMAHFAMIEEETVVQLSAMGPFGVTFIDPKDDPRIN